MFNRWVIVFPSTVLRGVSLVFLFVCTCTAFSLSLFYFYPRLSLLRWWGFPRLFIIAVFVLFSACLFFWPPLGSLPCFVHVARVLNLVAPLSILFSTVEYSGVCFCKIGFVLRQVVVFWFAVFLCGSLSSLRVRVRGPWLLHTVECKNPVGIWFRALPPFLVYWVCPRPQSGQVRFPPSVSLVPALFVFFFLLVFRAQPPNWLILHI